MKFPLLRPALAVGVALTLASCGGGKATYPINVTISGLQYSGLILTTNGQEVAAQPPAKAGDLVQFKFPNEIEYGQVYDVLPKGATDAAPTSGAQPAHQTCQPVTFLQTGTAGLLQTIDIRYQCSINAYPIGGTIKGLTGTGLVLVNGSDGYFMATPVTDTTTNLPVDIPYQIATSGGLSASPVAYGNTYGVQVLTQPVGQTCTVTGGNTTLNNGSGTIDDTAEKALGVNNIVVTCTKS